MVIPKEVRCIIWSQELEAVQDLGVSSLETLQRKVEFNISGDYIGDENVKLLYRYPKKIEMPLISRKYVQQRNEFGFGNGAFVHFTIRKDRADLYFYAKVRYSIL